MRIDEVMGWSREIPSRYSFYSNVSLRSDDSRLVEVMEAQESKTTLLNVYGGETPDEHEMIWNYISVDEFENEEFQIESVPVEIFDYLLEEYKKSTPNQKETVNYYRKGGLNEAKNSIKVVAQDRMLDGHHRMVALLLEKVSHTNVIDIS